MKKYRINFDTPGFYLNSPNRLDSLTIIDHKYCKNDTSCTDRIFFSGSQYQQAFSSRQTSNFHFQDKHKYRKMRVLSWNFTILGICGLWRPIELSNGWKKSLYTTYTFFTIFLTFTFTVSELIEFIISIDDVDKIVNNSLMLLTTLGICYKIANFVRKREEIVRLMEILNNDICDPRGTEEISIQMKFDARCRSVKIFIFRFFFF